MSRLIQFEGPWTNEEKRLVRSAALESAPPAACRAPVDSLWVATCHRNDEWAVFHASRYMLSGVVSAESATGLAEQIREVGSKVPPGSVPA